MVENLGAHTLRNKIEDICKVIFLTCFAALAVYGTLKQSPIKQGKSNELLCKMTYRRHNAYVIQVSGRILKHLTYKSRCITICKIYIK